MLKPRADWWREHYRVNRYLEHKSTDHVTSRMRYIIEAMLTLTPKGQIGVDSDCPISNWLMVKFTHTMHEFELRGISPPSQFLKGATVPRVSYPMPAPERDCYYSRQRKESGQLFRFGKKRWLEKTLSNGEVKINPASVYCDPSLNAAIQDDELAFTVFPTIPGDTSSLGGIKAAATVSSANGGYRLQHQSNYYVLCLSMRYSLRMYKDFEADSCLILYDAKEFERRVFVALQHMLPDYFVGCLPVTYVDPDDPGSEPLVIPQVKHMKYAYQAEVRFVSHPKTPKMKLNPISLSVGPLNDIAELICL